jgi:hypothetical protein
MINEGYQETFDKVKQGMLGNVSKLIKKYKNPDAIIYGKARKEAKKVQDMKNTNKLKEAVKAALMDEKANFSKKYDNNPALKGGQKKLHDKLQKAIIGSKKNIEEDLDLGHEDNEPHMIKADLYKIGKYAMELYQMVDQFEGQGEVDFPAWWQSKITNACNMISSAKHYLEFELKEPEINAMVSVAQNTGAIDNGILNTFGKKKGELAEAEEMNGDKIEKDEIRSRILQAFKQGKLTEDTYELFMKWIADPNSTKKAIIKAFESITGDRNVKEIIGKRKGELAEADVPSNIKKFAERHGVSSLVNKVAGWVEKVGAEITGGNAIGKNYNTLILDMGDQTSDIYINMEDKTIELYGKPANNFSQFQKVFMDKVTRDKIEKDKDQFKDSEETLLERVFNRIKNDQSRIKR